MFRINYEGLTYQRILTPHATPELLDNCKKDADYSFVVAYDNVLEDQDVEVLDKNACLFDLSLSDDDIVKAFNATGRNEYRRTFRTPGLEFHVGCGNLESYYTFYAACEHARAWYPVPIEELAQCLLFTASFEGEFISGMSCYTGGDTLRVSRIYSTKRINTNPAINGTIFGGAAKRLVVEICSYARTHGFKFVDLGGVDLSGNEKSGISEFKLSLGGKIVPVKIGRFIKPGFKEKQKEILARGFDIT
ncbi:MAG TPA: hypothetical protein PLU10_01195 [Chitinophagaceae bacterium]|nr:hypothetical protein [Chitinophagaceae bacterium]